VTERFAKRMLQGLAQLLNDPLRCSI